MTATDTFAPGDHVTYRNPPWYAPGEFLEMGSATVLSGPDQDGWYEIETMGDRREVPPECLRTAGASP